MVKLRNTFIKLFSIAFAVCTAFAIATMPTPAKAEAANFSMVQGASIRNEQDGIVGLKFQSTVNGGWLTNNDAERYTFGTLIYPAANGAEFDGSSNLSANIEALDAVSITHIENAKLTAGRTFNASIVYDRETIEAVIEQNGLEVTDELVEKVLRNLYNKDFTARSYAIADGQIYYTDAYTTSMYKVAIRTYELGVKEENEDYKALALNYFESVNIQSASINFYDGVLALSNYQATASTAVIKGNNNLVCGEEYSIDENGNIVFAVDYKKLGDKESIYLIDNGNLIIVNATHGGDVKSVSEVLEADVNDEVVLRGYYVGVTNLDPKSRDSEDYYAKTQLLIKDTQSDAIIGVRKNFAKFVSGTAAWTYTKQYTYGDEVIIRGELLADDITINQNYLEFGANNPANADTVISKGNIVNYSFNTAPTITAESTTWTNVFNSNIKPMTIVRFDGSIYGVRMCGDSTNSGSRTATRENLLTYNTEATKFSQIKVNSRYVTLLDNVLTANLGGTTWTSKIPYGGATASANWDSTKKEILDVDFYALYVGSTSDRYELVILENWWLDAHEHVYDNGEEISSCTVEGCTYKHAHKFEGDWLVETPATVISKGVSYRNCSTYGCTRKEYGEIEFANTVSIEITKAPNNTYYSVGDKLDPTGMLVTATGDNGSTCDVTRFVTIEDKALSYEDSTVTISYQGFTQTITLNMVEPHTHSFEGEFIESTPATATTEGSEYRKCTFENCNKTETQVIPVVEITSVEVTQNPDKMTYNVYETFDKSGMVVIGYGANEYSEDLSDFVTVTSAPLTLGANVITVSFNGVSTTLEVTAYENSVSDVSYDIDEETEVMVVGYFVGVANEGDSADQEMLIKDVDTDDIIAIRGVSYDTFANRFGYTYGDLVRISATLKVETDTQTLGKKYLAFSNRNGDKASTIISSQNAVNFSLENTVDFFEDTETEGGFWLSDTLNKTSNFYKIIKIQGCLFSFRYGATDDIVIHVNTEFTNTVLSKFKTNGKYITFRDDVTSLNVGADWIDYFGGNLIYSNSSTKAVGPGYATLVDMYAVYTGGDANTYQLTILSADWLNSTDTVVDGEYTNEEILKEVTLAYYRQAGQFQYNQTISRRNINASPEDATVQRQLYVDCSSFANAVFYEAFGMNIIADGVPIVKDGVTYDYLPPQTYNTQMYAEQYLGKDPAVLGVWKKGQYTEEVKNNIINNIQPGDVFNYRYGDGSSSRGHIMIYLGNNTFFHSRGGDFNNIGEDGVETAGQTSDLAWHYERCSTISFRDKSQLFNKDGDRYLFDKGVICWLRPLARENVTPTQNTVARMQYQGLQTEKTVSVGINSSVSRGDEITYNFTIVNNSRNNYQNVEVKEILDSDVTLVSAPSGYVLDGNTLTFNFDIDFFSTVEFSFTVRVNDNVAAGSLIESMQTTIGGILTTRVYNLVSGYTATELNSVATKAKGYASSSASFDNAIDFVKAIYSDLNVTAFDNYDSVSSVLGELLDTSKDELITTSALASMVVPDLYGGRQMSNMYVSDADVVRLIKELNLSVGDVILADYTSGETYYYALYVYVGNGQLVMYSSESTIAPNGEVCTLKTMNESQYSSANVLVTLFAYSRYAIIRPSMVA